MLACFHLGKLLNNVSMLSYLMQLAQIQNLETKAPREIKMLFWVVFAGSKGAHNRIKIVNLLKNTPYNLNQLSGELNLDYKTIQHHIRVLEKNNFVSKNDSAYPTVYLLTPQLEFHMNVLDEIQVTI